MEFALDGNVTLAIFSEICPVYILQKQEHKGYTASQWYMRQIQNKIQHLFEHTKYYTQARLIRVEPNNKEQQQSNDSKPRPHHQQGLNTKELLQISMQSYYLN